MRTSDPIFPPAREAIAFLLVSAVVVTLIQSAFYQMQKPQLDALRYVDYALNIHDHGVFGLSGHHRDAAPEPGNANSPLYPAILAAALYLDTDLEISVRCALTHRGQDLDPCPEEYATILWLQNGLIVVALFFFWSTTRALFNQPSIAWLSCALALASTKPLFYSNNFLTELLVLSFFPLLMFALVAVLKSRRRRWWLLTGVVTGLMTLARPEYLYLGYCFMFVGIIVIISRRFTNAAPGLLVFVLAFYAVVAPWLIRNHHHFGQHAVTGGYADVTIAYRSAYNRMTLQEWTAAFVYWLPAHGEALATRIFPPSSYAKLGTDPQSYVYLEGREIFNFGLAAVDGDRDRLASYLVRTEIVAHPFTHAYASIPLAWRGILAGKYLAALGVPCLTILTFIAWRRRCTTILLLLMPALTMIALYAAVSVSIPRYNVYLIYYYAIAVAWATVKLVEKKRLRK